MNHVLIVDDEKDIGALVSVMLTAAGFKTAYASSIEEARSFLVNSSFDKIFLDLNLGRAHGTDLLPDIRREQPKAEVVIISAYADAHSREAFDAMGIKKIIKKPFSKAQLLDVLK